MFDFGLRIKELRQQHRLFQEQLGRKVDRKTTLDIYTDVSEEFVKGTMSRFAGQIYLG